MARLWNDVLHSPAGAPASAWPVDPLHPPADSPHPVDDAACRLKWALVRVDVLESSIARMARATPAVPDVIPKKLLRQLEELRSELVPLRALIADAAKFAYHDELTGLPNRVLLLDRMKQAMAQATRQQKKMGVLLLDLNGFKGINDHLGHHAGDQVLIHVASLLSSCIRTGDTACRYGGDEFVVMLPEIDDVGAMAAVAEKISGRLAAPFELEGHVLRITASIGMALYPTEAATITQLIQRADAAMYRMKGRTAAIGRRQAARH